MLKKNDFVEIEFTGMIKGNGIFDTTREEDAEKAGIDKNKCKPLKICIGQRMLIKGFDEALEGKEAGKNYTIELAPENAFGKRQQSLVRVMPSRPFLEKGIAPQAGAMYSFDNMLAKIISVSGGRVTVDFNNPLSGRDVIYDFTVKRIIEDKKEKISVIVDFVLHIENPEIKTDDKENKAALVVENKIPDAVFEILKSKVKELLDTELLMEIKSKKEEKGNEKEEATEIKKGDKSE